MTAYELSIDLFSGPLEKLLELIEKRELDITAISLAAVTDDFVKYVESLENAPPALLADFISVASQLLLLKSRALLPNLPLTAEEEEEIQGLEERLRIYGEIRQAFKVIQSAWRSSPSIYGRSYMPTVSLVAQDEDAFYPGKTVDLDSVVSAGRNALSFLVRAHEETETVREKIIRLEDKMAEILSRMQSVGKTNFKQLAQSGTKSELIVVFLALLHLAREQTVELEQGDRFSDIMVASGSNKTPYVEEQE